MSSVHPGRCRPTESESTPIMTVHSVPWHSTTAHGAVVAGASLAPSEDLQDQLLLLLATGWLLAMTGSLAMTCVGVLWLGSARSGRERI
jgi:hypothetical protein